MWLLSFAWRNRNLKQKQKGNRAKRKMRQIEGKQTPSHTAEHHPAFSTSYFNKKNTIYAWKTLPLQQGQLLMKVHLQDRSKLTLSPN